MKKSRFSEGPAEATPGCGCYPAWREEKLKSIIPRSGPGGEQKSAAATSKRPSAEASVGGWGQTGTSHRDCLRMWGSVTGAMR